jgi:hypothetical protein
MAIEQLAWTLLHQPQTANGGHTTSATRPPMSPQIVAGR